jgi:hypothetical protein
VRYARLAMFFLKFRAVISLVFDLSCYHPYQ